MAKNGRSVLTPRESCRLLGGIVNEFFGIGVAFGLPTATLPAPKNEEAKKTLMRVFFFGDVKILKSFLPWNKVCSYHGATNAVPTMELSDVSRK